MAAACSDLRNQILQSSAAAVFDDRDPTAAAQTVLAVLQQQQRFLTLISSQLCALDVQGAGSSNNKAVEEHERGSRFFKSGAYKDAVVHYTASLQQLDQTESQSSHEKTAQLLLNRSLCLLRLRPPQVSLALQDCHQVIQCRQDDPKAFYRRACAHQALRQFPEALRDALASQELYSSTSKPVPHDVTKLVAKLQSEVAACNSDIASKLQHVQCRGPSGASTITAIQNGPENASHAEEPAAAALHLTHKSIEGRHLQAAVSVSKGALLFHEDPVSAVLLKPHRKEVLPAAA
ncbi:hypothetical protein WJX74_009515 [Apatococcus lobatus]|uniref:Tetratricopeptide repeat-containing protein n=1 Tax=Apatococcus lobatus TaxID=904363 RepID=A0AAW1R095_9CHLO